MSGSDEILIGSADFQKLPTFIQVVIPQLFGPQVTAREMYSYGRAKKLYDSTVQQIRGGLNVNRLEALSFSQRLLKASNHEHMDPAFLAKVMMDNTYYSFDPDKRLYIKEDCQALSDQLISTVRKNAPKYSLIEAIRIPFTRSPSNDPHDNGSEQNMALFGVDGEIPEYYLVDCAAYYYNPVWAKAWKSDSVENVLKIGADWLTQGEGLQPWNIPRPPRQWI